MKKILFLLIILLSFTIIFKTTFAEKNNKNDEKILLFEIPLELLTNDSPEMQEFNKKYCSEKYYFLSGYISKNRNLDNVLTEAFMKIIKAAYSPQKWNDIKIKNILIKINFIKKESTINISGYIGKSEKRNQILSNEYNNIIQKLYVFLKKNNLKKKIENEHWIPVDAKYDLKLIEIKINRKKIEIKMKITISNPLPKKKYRYPNEENMMINANNKAPKQGACLFLGFLVKYIHHEIGISY